MTISFIKDFYNPDPLFEYEKELFLYKKEQENQGFECIILGTIIVLYYTLF